MREVWLESLGSRLLRSSVRRFWIDGCCFFSQFWNVRQMIIAMIAMIGAGIYVIFRVFIVMR